MDLPTITELLCFRTVAEELNFSRAAARLHMSQPPLSRHVQSLERKLGADLLIRNTRTVTLTNAGRLYLADVRVILSRLDAAGEAVRRSSQGETTRLRIAFVGALLEGKLFKILQRFRRAHPHCQIHLNDLPPNAQLEALATDEIDGAFIGALPATLPKELSAFIWKREKLSAVLPNSHPLAKQSSVRLSELAASPWVMVTRKSAPAFRKLVARLCMKSRFQPRVVEESDRVPAVLTMVAAEQGISILPESLRRLVSDEVSFVPLKDPGAILEHAFAYRARSAKAEIKAFAEIVRSDA